MMRTVFNLLFLFISIAGYNTISLASGNASGSIENWTGQAHDARLDSGIVPTDTISLDEVQITSTKTSVARENVPFTVSVITRREIEQSGESALLPVLSAQVPGLFVTQRGVTGFGVAGGSAGQISIRGVGGSPTTQVLMLINGQPQFMGLMGHPLPDAYVASDAERVEVIRGPASVLYGTNAMGGVINIITREQQKEGFSGNARASYGSFNTQKYMLSGGYRAGKLDVFASINHDRTDGHRDSSNFKITNGYLKWGLRLNERFKVSTDVSVAAFEATDPGMASDKAGNSIDILRGMASVGISNKYSRTDGSFSFFYNFGIHDISDGYHSTDNNLGMIAYQNFRLLPGNLVTFGVDLQSYGGIASPITVMDTDGEGKIIRVNGRPKMILSPYNDVLIRNNEVSTYVFARQTLLEKLVVNGGARVVHNDKVGTEFIPQLGMVYRYLPHGSVKINAAKGFRNPTIRELYLFPPANEELEPERMWNYEVGIAQGLMNNRLRLEITGFLSKGENLIATIQRVPYPPLNINTGKFANKGFEFAVAYNPSRDIRVNANYTLLSMDTPLLATPQHQAYTGVTYSPGRFDLHLNGQLIDGLYTRLAQGNVSSITYSYFLVNSRVAFRVNHFLGLFLSLENILDELYEINYGYPMPGRTMVGGVNIKF